MYIAIFATTYSNVSGKKRKNWKLPSSNALSRFLFPRECENKLCMRKYARGLPLLHD